MVSPDGDPIALSAMRGRTVLLNFWRRNCKYCAQEKIRLRRLVQQINRPNLEVLCVNVWDSPGTVGTVARRTGSGLLFAARPSSRTDAVAESIVDGQLMGYYVLNSNREAVYEVQAFPTTYVIDKTGKVVACHLGLAEWDSKPVRAWLQNLMGPPETASLQHGVADRLPSWLHDLLAGPLVLRGPTREGYRESATAAKPW
jgi:peroxiredoxin